ncbi:MAG TPA: hypothetical protein VI424_08180, partial [Terriglobales bacterium]
MNGSEAANYQNRILSSRLRWLAVAAGCVSGIALVSFGVLSVFGILPIVGAAIQRPMPRVGRLVLYVGAALLTYIVIPFGIIVLRDTVKTGFLYLDFNYLTITWAWLLSPALIIWCDAAL